MTRQRVALGLGSLDIGKEGVWRGLQTGRRGPGAHVQASQHFLLGNGLGQRRTFLEQSNPVFTRSR